MLRPRRSKALLAPRPKLFDCPAPDVASKIRACQASGVALTAFQKKFLDDFAKWRRPSQGMWRIFWGICGRCGVGQ